MKYFLIEMNEKNRTPYNINKNRELDIRLLTKEKINDLPTWNVVEMDFPREGFFPDVICSPCILLSEICMRTVMMYQPDILCKGIRLWDKKSGANATYFLPILEEADCMSERTQFNSVGNRITKLVLDRDKIGERAVFRIKGMDRNCIAGRMDFVESMLRREVRGIKLSEVDVEVMPRI